MANTSNDEANPENLPFHPSVSLYDDVTYIKISNSSSFNILYLNARSLQNKTIELNYIIEQVKKSIPVIAISEHWLDNEKLKYFNFNNYEVVFACRPDKPGGGAGFLISNSLVYSVVKIYSDNSISYVCVCVKINGKKIYLSVFYRPPDKRNDSINFFFQ